MPGSDGAVTDGGVVPAGGGRGILPGFGRSDLRFLGACITALGVSGELRTTRGSSFLFSGTATATRWSDSVTVDLSFEVVRIARSWLPGGSGFSRTSAHSPRSFASAVATASGPSKSSTVVLGAARPAITVSPEGSTRTMSKVGTSPAAGVFVDGAAAVDSPSRRLGARRSRSRSRRLQRVSRQPEPTVSTVPRRIARRRSRPPPKPPALRPDSAGASAACWPLAGGRGILRHGRIAHHPGRGRRCSGSATTRRRSERQARSGR